MKFIIKLFPEITIKSPSIRLLFIKILSTNIRKVLEQYDDVLVVRHWDYIEVRIKDEQNKLMISDALTRIPGIHHILVVEDSIYTNMHHIFEQTLDVYRDKLINKTFCVRVKRRGKQNFTSQETECYIGHGLYNHIKSSRVNLSHPQVIVNLEIKDNKLRLIKERSEGIGGFPIGTQENVLSLISGGFDSGVSSYMMMRRGCRVHFCFFNLGSMAHEISVQNLAYYLWNRFSRSHKIRFISIDFTLIVAAIVEKVKNSYRGVVLKRMMMRAASLVAESYGVNALVTGEALGQVSSQTLTNLHLIDHASDILILRPLIAYDKQNIIDIARKIGTDVFAKSMPEYCGIISTHPTAKAIKSDIEKEESQFDLFILNRVVHQAKSIDISTLYDSGEEKINHTETVFNFSKNDIILDIRSLDEQKNKLLQLDKVEVQSLPFYKLSSQFCTLDKNKNYWLYCESGVMSRLQALYLLEQGYSNVKVYCP